MKTVLINKQRMPIETDEQIKEVREVMRRHGIAAALIWEDNKPTEEYLPLVQADG